MTKVSFLPSILDLGFVVDNVYKDEWRMEGGLEKEYIFVNLLLHCYFLTS